MTYFSNKRIQTYIKKKKRSSKFNLPWASQKPNAVTGGCPRRAIRLGPLSADNRRAGNRTHATWRRRASPPRLLSLIGRLLVHTAGYAVSFRYARFSEFSSDETVPYRRLRDQRRRKFVYRRFVRGRRVASFRDNNASSRVANRRFSLPRRRFPVENP